VDGSDHADRRGSRDGPHSGVQTVNDKAMSRNRRANRHNNNRVAGVIDVEPSNLLPFEPDMAKASAPAGGEALLIGLEAFIPPRAAIAAGTLSSMSVTAAWKPAAAFSCATRSGSTTSTRSPRS
jgi:hypothetical protein